jgi:hypothetical protein
MRAVPPDSLPSAHVCNKIESEMRARAKKRNGLFRELEAAS